MKPKLDFSRMTGEQTMRVLWESAHPPGKPPKTHRRPKAKKGRRRK